MKTHELFAAFPKNVSIVHRERFDSSNGTCTLVYGDETSRIRIGCFFGVIDYPIYDLKLVPDEIADQGSEAVRAHAHAAVRILINALRAHTELRKQRMLELHAVYQIEVQGVTVKGFVKMDDLNRRGDELKLVMTEPFQLERFLHIRPSCFAEAMGQSRTFDEDGALLPEEVERQIGALRNLYQREQHRRTKPPAHATLQALVRKA